MIVFNVSVAIDQLIAFVVNERNAFLFKSILNDKSCLHYLLPEQRNVEITEKLRHAASYEPPTVRTIKCQRSFINFALEHYQNC